MDIKATLAKPRKRSAWDVVPGVVAGALAIAFAGRFHGSPLPVGLVIGTSALIAFYVAYSMSCYARARAIRNFGRKNIRILISMGISFGFSVVLLVIGGLTLPGELAHMRAGGAQASAATIAKQQDHIAPFTTVQDAPGYTEHDMTMTALDKWAAFLVRQGKVSAKHKCVTQGLDPNICAKIDSTETHELVDVSGHRVGVIRFRTYLSGRFSILGVRVMRIMHQKVVTVACINTDGHPISLSAGSCAAELWKNLKVRFPSVSAQ